MNLPDAPIAREGFWVTQFFTVRDQEKSKDFYVRILGGKVIKPEILVTSSWPIPKSSSIPAAAPHRISPRLSSRLLPISTK